MKKLILIFTLAVFTTGFFSCTCECVGPANTGNGDKVCRTEYENAYGPGTWQSYEASMKGAGYICK